MNSETRRKLSVYRETKKERVISSETPSRTILTARGPVRYLLSTCYFCETDYAKDETNGYCPSCGAVRTH